MTTLPLLAAPLIKAFLGRINGPALRGVARGASEDTRSLVERLFAMTIRANAEQAKTRGLYRRIAGLQSFLVPPDELSEDETDTDSDPSCTVCGRIGGQGTFFTIAPDDHIMCEQCHEADPLAPEVTSFF